MLTPGSVDTLKRAPGSRGAIIDFIVSARALHHGPNDIALRPVEQADPQPQPDAIWGVDLPLVLDPAIAPTCVDAIAGITNSYWKSPYQHHRANLKLALLLDTIVDNYYRPDEQEPEQSHDPVVRSRALIDERLAEIPNAEALAAALNLSPDHLARLFKKSMGESAAVYLRRLRRERAAELLATTRLPVATIASMVGYRNHMTLAHAWARHYDVPPLTWRQEQQG